MKVLFKANTQKHKENIILQLKIYQVLLVVSEIHTSFFMIQIFVVPLSGLSSVPFLSSASALLNYFTDSHYLMPLLFLEYCIFLPSSPNSLIEHLYIFQILTLSSPLDEDFSVELNS